MSYTPRLAAALSGTTLSQLAYWRRVNETQGPVLVPEVSCERPILYSFRDVIALRTLSYLREEVSLQRIRAAISNLRELGEEDHLAQYQLVSDGGTVFVRLKTDETVDLYRQPGQQAIAEFVDIIGPFRNMAGVKVPALLQPRKRLRVNAEVLGGYPVIRGTRVPYDVVAELVDDGLEPAEVKRFYPSVSAEAARDAVKFSDYVARAA